MGVTSLPSAQIYKLLTETGTFRMSIDIKKSVLRPCFLRLISFSKKRPKRVFDGFTSPSDGWPLPDLSSLRKITPERRFHQNWITNFRTKKCTSCFGNLIHESCSKPASVSCPSGLSQRDARTSVSVVPSEKPCSLLQISR